MVDFRDPSWYDLVNRREEMVNMMEKNQIVKKRPKALLKRVAYLEEAVMQLIILHWGDMVVAEYDYEMLPRNVQRSHSVAEEHGFPYCPPEEGPDGSRPEGSESDGS